MTSDLDASNPRSAQAAPTGWSARLRSLATPPGPRLLLPLLVTVAATPFCGLAVPAAWLAVMMILALAEGRANAAPLACWLSSLGYSVCALYLVLRYGGAAQSLGVTLFGVIIFDILVREYHRPRRMALALVPPVASILFVQSAAIYLRVTHHRPLEIITVIASPFAVAWVFRSLQTSLVRSRDRLAEATLQTEADFRKMREGRRVAMMAEELAGVGHWRFDVATGRFSWSDGVYRIVGLTPGEIAPGPETLPRYWLAEDQKLVGGSLARAISDGVPFSLEARLVRQDGAIRHVVSNGAAERGASGVVTTVFGAILDVTEARLRELELGRSEARYRLIAENATDVIMQFSRSGVIEFVTPACEPLLGYAPDQLVGMRSTELCHPDDVAHMLSNVEALIAAGPGAEPVANQLRLRRKDGGWVWIEGRPKIVFGEDGRVALIQDVIRDISERKAADEALAAAHQAAEAAATAKSDFLANMSHEIRTPLTAILGFSDLLERNASLDEAARLSLRRIANGGRTLLSVVNDILDFSKLEAGQVELDPHAFDPADAMAGAIDLVAGQATAKGLALELDLTSDLPPAVLADSARLRQILLNLLSNALKFTASGHVRLSAAYSGETGMLEISVADTGSGIPADKLDRLFERFSQADGSINRKHGGTGLGLAICKSLVERMGGQIAVQSAEGAGAIFSFSIAAPTTDAPPRIAVPAPLASSAEETRAARILIVDDLAENRELVRLVLEALGHAVAEAAGGAEAVALAGSEPFDVILMDLQMPGVDGLTAARRIRAGGGLNAQSPILALSANVMAEQVAQCLEAGMNDHVAKPLQIAELASKVQMWAEAERPAAGSARAAVG